jgi:hypothetical protein
MGESMVIRLKRALTILSASVLLTVASCTPNSGFTLIYATEEVGSEVNVNNHIIHVIRKETK